MQAFNPEEISKLLSFEVFKHMSLFEGLGEQISLHQSSTGTIL